MGRSPSNPLRKRYAITLFFVLEAVLLKPGIFELYAETWHGFFIGLLGFFFGFLFVYVGRPLWETLRKWKWLYLAIAAGLYVVRLTMYNLKSPDALMAIESNSWIFGALGLGFSYLNKPGALLTYLSKAAYPVYIIHMFALYGGAVLILLLALPVSLKFVLIVGFTGIVCFLLFEFVIRRIRLLRPFFGLKAEGKAPEPLTASRIARNPV